MRRSEGGEEKGGKGGEGRERRSGGRGGTRSSLHCEYLSSSAVPSPLTDKYFHIFNRGTIGIYGFQ